MRRLANKRKTKKYGEIAESDSHLLDNYALL
uniref:Uncharacterized protein n=1 Tax=virus sp. ctmTa7 TaxID=2828255 RepID=A0A8S5RCQ6_9VIRU|nr:MAG TPA: hypothetical protein [virus sp. ctmTa7]